MFFITLRYSTYSKIKFFLDYFHLFASFQNNKLIFYDPP